MIRPLRDFVLLEVAALPDRTESGLHLPESQRGREHLGVVLAVGAGAYTKKGLIRPPGVSVGDTVRFDPYEEVHEVQAKPRHVLVREKAIVYVEGGSGGLAPNA